MKEIEQLAAAAIGLDAQRGDVLAVQNLSFQEPVLPKPAPPGKSKLPASSDSSGWPVALSGDIPLFLIVYFLMLRPVKKQIMTSLRELPARMAHSKKKPGSRPGGARRRSEWRSNCPQGPTRHAGRAR